MSNILLSAPGSLPLGKEQGAVIQQFGQGLQVRNRATPRNPRVATAQHWRQQFRIVVAHWRTLSSASQTTWSSSAPPGVTALNFHNSCNLNLLAAGYSLIPAFATGFSFSSPLLTFVGVTQSQIFVAPAVGFTTVPAGLQLLLYASRPYFPTINSKSRPFLLLLGSLPPGTPIYPAIDIAPFLIARFGPLPPIFTIFARSSFVEISNGLREDSSIVHTQTNNMLPYLAYAAILTSNGTNPPVVVEMPGNTIGAIIWSRNSAGDYFGTLSGAFPAGKTLCLSNSNGDGSLTFTSIIRTPAGVVEILSVNIAGVPTDNLLAGFNFEIRVYP